MRFFTACVTSIGVFIALAAGSDSPSLMDLPLIGYVAQSSPPELRAIVGVPGAAVLTDPLPLPSNVRRIHLPPDQQYVLLERSEGDPAVLLLNGDDTNQMIPIPGALSAPNIVAFSRSGSSVVLFGKSTGRLQVITGLPHAPSIAQVFDTTLLPDIPRALSVSDDGRYLLASSPSIVYEMADTLTHIVANVAGVPSLAFLPANAGAVIGDRSAGLVYVVENRAAGPTTKVVATDLAGLGDISPAEDGETLYISNPSGNRIWSLRVSTRELGSYELAVRPARIEHLRNIDMFLIVSGIDQPAWIFFRQGQDFKTVFVPAAPHFQKRRIQPPGRLPPAAGLATVRPQ